MQHDLADIVQRDGTMLEIRLYDHHFLMVEAAKAGLGVALSSRQRTTSIEGGSSHLPVSIATKATMASSGQENLSCPGKHTILLDGCKHSAR
ncbi:hypothetical protein XI09_06810 [Bradyrhizobium sp. CCBAU 11386]|nr:hypothetical protein [Bradyrhizobium sp. CCBAU 11386]